MTLKIWHNPRCSKSRQTLELLQNAGHDPEVIRYQDAPPTAADIRNTLALLNIPAIELIRSQDALFKELGLSKTSDESTLITAMAENPILIERPVVFAKGKAAIGRPPETVLKLFD